MKKIFVVTLVLTVTGCASYPAAMPKIDPETTPAEVFVLRQDGVIGYTRGSSYFGEKESDEEIFYLELSNGEYGELLLNPGLHVFLASAPGTASFELEVRLEPGKKRCFHTLSGADNIGKMLIAPLLVNLTPMYKIEEMECPDQNELTKYSHVEK